MSDTEIVEATFDIDSWDETAYDEPAEGPKLTKVVITKTYRGRIEGSSTTELLTCQGADGSGGYVASERVVGTFDGREGTFVIQHSGLADGEGHQSTSGAIVPKSGTGELAGISGEAEEVAHGVLTLRIWRA